MDPVDTLCKQTFDRMRTLIENDITEYITQYTVISIRGEDYVLGELFYMVQTSLDRCLVLHFGLNDNDDFFEEHKISLIKDVMATRGAIYVMEKNTCNGYEAKFYVRALNEEVVFIQEKGLIANDKTLSKPL